MYDVHVHSTYSKDGVSELSEYIGPLREGIVHGIGFAEHVDFLPECGSYGFFDYERFTGAIHGYRDLGLAFFTGAEIDYSKNVENDILGHLKKNKYDYVIGSVHMIEGLSVSNKVDIPKLGWEKLWDILEKYYQAVLDSLIIDGFGVVGHMGVFKRYLPEEFFRNEQLLLRLRELESEVAGMCVLHNKIVEVNTSGLFSPMKATIPGPDFLKRFYDLGGRRVCIGSDAHCVTHVARGFDVAREMLAGIGFQSITLPWGQTEKI